MRNYYNIIIRIVVILVIFITIGWYGKLDHVHKSYKNEHIKHYMLYETAKKELRPPVSKSKLYYFYNTSITTYTRTTIPFKYDKGVTVAEKEYYAE